MHKILFAFLLFVTSISYGQLGTGYDFSFKVKFAPSIPVEDLEIFYIEYGSNFIQSINYKTTKNNEIYFSGHNSVVTANEYFFPTIIFSLKSEKKLPYSNSTQEITNLYFLISKTVTYDPKFFDKEIYFLNDNVNVVYVTCEWKNAIGNYNLENTTLYNLPNEDILPLFFENKYIKINRSDL